MESENGSQSLLKKPESLFFAPMEPLTANPILREIMVDFGADILCRPKILPQHLLKAKKWQFWERMQRQSQKSTIDGIQLIARPDDPIAAAVKFLNENSRALDIKYIDLNFCCPGYKVLPQRRGGELLKEPKTIIKVIEKVLKYSELPVSIKIRKGYTVKDNPTELLAKIHREFRSNISWITVNRAPVKMHNVKMINVINDITPFQQAVEAVEQQIPIIANGGFIRPTQVLAIIRNLHLSGVMIGRGALGYPSFFQKILDLNKGNGKKIQLNEKERFIHGLRAFLEKIYYYATHGQGRWTTLGELKRQLYPFIKFKYSSEKGGLPTGYGFDKWHKIKFSPSTFSKALAYIFPEFSSQFWLNWVNSLPFRQKK
ncbi:MAG: hypothetical protein DRO88_11000 [Promethearchaeia archaeon]|nr:MAG: hypothetical protein DRO88_11000 [Candidatus Lokiarchaeia archaeon]